MRRRNTAKTNEKKTRRGKRKKPDKDKGEKRCIDIRRIKTKKTRKKYMAALGWCNRCVRLHNLPMRRDVDIDHALTAHMNHHYFKGFQSHVGETLVSAFIDSSPDFGKYGVRRTPRAWRAVRAWRRLTPSRSRRPWPPPLWADIAVTLSFRGAHDMAVFLFLGLGTLLDRRSFWSSGARM